MKENYNELAIERILDENNNENVTLCNTEGVEYEFMQIASIPEGDILYAILKPVDPSLFEVDDDQAFVFSIEEQGDLFEISLVEDEEVLERIFNKYFALYDQLNNN